MADDDRASSRYGGKKKGFRDKSVARWDADDVAAYQKSAEYELHSKAMARAKELESTVDTVKTRLAAADEAVGDGTFDPTGANAIAPKQK